MSNQNDESLELEVKAGFPGQEGTETLGTYKTEGSAKPEFTGSQEEAAPEPAAAPEKSEAESKVEPEVPEWRKAVDEMRAELQSEYETKLDTMQQRVQKGVNKSVGKLRNRVDNVKSLIDDLVPEVKREHYGSDAEFQAAKDVVDPIREKAIQQEQELEQTEADAANEARAQALARNYVSNADRLKESGVDVDAIHGRYNQVIAQYPQLDIPKGPLLSYVHGSPNGALLLQELYSDPKNIATVLSMGPEAGVARLGVMEANLSGQTTQAAPVADTTVPGAQPKSNAPVNQPAVPPRGGAAGVSNPLAEATSGVEYYRALRAKRGKS